MAKRMAAGILGLVILMGVMGCGFGTEKTGGKKTEEKGTAFTYEVEVPEDYAESKRNYPVVYLMPEDGYRKASYEMDPEGTMDMIVVRPSFSEHMDVPEVMKGIVEEVDGQYRTIPDPSYRGIVGLESGGYLAYILGFGEESEGLFTRVASIRGDFTGKENPWYDAYGDVYQMLEKLHARDESFYENTWTYLDGVAEDALSVQRHGTDDLGSLFIGWDPSMPQNVHEFTLRAGSYDPEFLEESMRRVTDRLTRQFADGLVEGEVSLESAVLTEDVPTAAVRYSVAVTDKMKDFLPEGDTEMKIHITVSDPRTGAVLTETDQKETVQGAEEFSGEAEVENLVQGVNSTVTLSAEILGADLEVGTAKLVRLQQAGTAPEEQLIDLMGDWKFQYVGEKDPWQGEKLTEKDFDSWDTVLPALDNWDAGFGNIEKDWWETIGWGWYARTFDVPADFTKDPLILSIGYLDDRGEVYVNGKRAGATGVDKKGKSTQETTWAVYSKFALDPFVLHYGKRNTIAVHVYNDPPYGAGGWYNGPVGIYSQEAFDRISGGVSGFQEESYDSALAASASGKKGTIEEKYMVYLPKDYEESDRYYPTVYLLHQYNSDHTSYRTDHIDRLLEEAAEAGKLDEMILVVPNSSEESFWRGDWEKMITEELVPLIDQKYRTIRDARYRLTAGASMGGQGAYGVALRNPDTFSGAISFFGAFSLWDGEDNPIKIASEESADYLKYFALYFMCGNRDMYGFGVPAIELDKQLKEKDVPHQFFIENGDHNSAFYLPCVTDAFAWTRKAMYQSDDRLEKQLSGRLTADVSGNSVNVDAEVTVADGIRTYLNQIPASSYTREERPALQIALMLQVEQEGKVVYTAPAEMLEVTGETTQTYSYGLCDVIDVTKDYKITWKGAVLDRVITLDTEN